MLKFRFLTLAPPLAMQMSVMSASVLASEDPDEQKVITITAVSEDGDEARKAAEEKIKAVKAAIDVRVEKAKAEAEKAADERIRAFKIAIEARVEKARAEAEKGKGEAPKAKAEAKVKAQIFETRLDGPTILFDRVESADGKQITVRGQLKAVSPDGKTLDVITRNSAKGAGELVLREKAPAGVRAYSIIHTRDGDEIKQEGDDLNAVLGHLTARVNEAVEAPKFIIGVSVSEAPAVVLSQIGKPELAAVVVENVVDGSPAEKAGVKKLDLILKAAGEPVKSAGELTKAVKSVDGKEIELVLVRSGKELTVQVKPKSNEPTPRKTKVADGMIQFGPGMILDGPHARWMTAQGQMGMGPGNLTEEIKSLRKDIEELKKMIEELKAAK